MEIPEDPLPPLMPSIISDNLTHSQLYFDWINLTFAFGKI
jgi:hypothetical protein